MGFNLTNALRTVSGLDILEGVYNRISGKPTPVTPVTPEKLPPLTPEERTAFNLTPEELRYIDYISNQVYNPSSAPSAAQSLLNQATNQSAMQAGGMIANARGATNPVLAARQAQQAMTEAQQGAINSATAMRAQEQQAAQNQYSDQVQRQRQAATQLVNTERGINQANVNAQNQANAANATAYTQSAQNAANNQASMLGMAGAGMAQGYGQKLGTAEAGAGAGGAGAGGAGAGGATLLAAGSDIKLKKNIGNGENAIYGFLDSLDPYTYEYKDGGPKGTDDYEHIGIMAQDAERSPAGQRIVTEDKKGNKMLKPDLSTLLAAQAFNHKRLKELEAKNGVAGSQEIRPSRITAPTKNLSGAANSLARIAQSIGIGGGRGSGETQAPPIESWPYKGVSGGFGGAGNRGMGDTSLWPSQPTGDMPAERKGEPPMVFFGKPEITYHAPTPEGEMPIQEEQIRPNPDDYENIKRYLDMMGGQL